MLSGRCVQCGVSGALSSFTAVGDKLCCQVCAEKVAAEARARGEKPRVASVIDPTICFKCKRDNGSQALPTIGHVPYCSVCSEELFHRPFPQWLQLGLAGLLGLLVFALLHGKPYFSAGRSLLHGQKLVEHGQWAEAIPYLQAALKVAPDCEDGVLLLGKAYALTGRPEEGYKLLQEHNGGQFETNELFEEVQRIYARVDQAIASAEQADKLYKQQKWDEASQAMHRAADLYPELPGFRDAAAAYDGTAAFERKDYDAFLRIARGARERHPNSPEVAGMLASALACKYAVTGEPDFRTECERMLDVARGLAQSSPEASALEKEFEARTRYRLQSRRIIDKDEYDRRFGNKQSGQKPKGSG